MRVYPTLDDRANRLCRVLFLRRHAVFGGSTGSGKSGGLNVLMGNLTACQDAIIWAIDPSFAYGPSEQVAEKGLGKRVAPPGGVGERQLADGQQPLPDGHPADDRPEQIAGWRL